jgi:hypothetical protein
MSRQRVCKITSPRRVIGVSVTSTGTGVPSLALVRPLESVVAERCAVAIIAAAFLLR